MRDELTAAVRARWEKSLAGEATDCGDCVGEVEEGVDDFLAVRSWHRCGRLKVLCQALVRHASAARLDWSRVIFLGAG
jgi:hypothetical protein